MRRGSCPFCGKGMLAKYVDKHVLKSHQGTFVCDKSLFPFSYGVGGVGFYCWCGELCTSYASVLSHWKKAGGVLAHILEVSLGGKHEQS